MCVAAFIGLRAEQYGSSKCARNISKDLLYQREIARDPGMLERLKKQAEEAGIEVGDLIDYSLSI